MGGARGHRRAGLALIPQLAVEVHDIDGRVARMRTLLEGKGYSVVVEPAEWATHRLMGLHMLYASRGTAP